MAVVHSNYREAGQVSVNEQACTHCGLCASLCPTETLKMESGKLTISTQSSLGCIACGHCMMACPQGAIRVTGRGISPDDLIPLSKSQKPASVDALSSLMQSRRSIRHFSDQPVDPDTVRRIIDLASTAPMGIPPWDVGCVSVLGHHEVQQVADEIVKGYQGFLKIFKPGLLTLMRPFMGQTKYDMFYSFIRPLAISYVESHQKGQDKLFYNAPALLIFYSSPYADPFDAGIACTYAMLAAESLGLGSTIIGGAPPIMKRNKALCGRLGIPDASSPSIAMILGHPKVSFCKTIRRHFTHVEIKSV